jgi:hypothetical protein
MYCLKELKVRLYIQSLIKSVQTKFIFMVSCVQTKFVFVVSCVMLQQNFSEHLEIFKHISSAIPCCSYSIWHLRAATILSDTTITSNSGFSVVCHVGDVHDYGKASICQILSVTWENRDEYEMVRTTFQEEAVSCVQVLSGSAGLELGTHP